ncbi:hypothetical protein TC41_1813 [Calderihabitans maritimus]|uniref:Transposase n=2 Tax=Calderihabitans maritimus TaxID=1246530 RepID=A0A1Z5HPS9_9FIRM|nr:hypothetical protein TC41_1813 [Calderihabitans maritimus]
MIPADHPLVKIKENVDFSFVTDAVKHLYDPDKGRRSFPPETLFRILFLEVWANLSDVQVCRELQYNVLYRYFCNIGWDDPVPDDTTLVVFRKRLGQETFQELFNRLVEQAREKGYLRGEWALIDGTKVVAHVAAKNTLSLAREGRKRLLKELAKVDTAKAEELKEYAEPLPDGDYPTHKELLAAEIARGKELVNRLKDRSELRKTVETYEAILEGRGVSSFSDPDARWGFQKKDEPFLGYKVHAVCEETGIVTGVKVTPGNETEVDQVEEMVDDLIERDLKPRRLAGDKAYDGSDLRKDLSEKGIRTYVPNRTKKDRLQQQGFTYDRKSKTVQCQEGKKAIGSTPHRKGGLTFYFSKKDCQRCPRKDSCLSKSETRKRVYVRPEVFENRPRGIKHAMRMRKTIERVFGEAKTWHRMMRARYRCLERVAIQVLMTFICLNAKKMAHRARLAPEIAAKMI